MMNTDLKALIAKLNDTCRNSLEAAAGLCLSRTNYNVEIEHVLMKLIEARESDFERIVRHFEINEARLSADLTRALDRLKRGNARTPALAPQLPSLIQEAWLIASIDDGASRVRSGHLFLALLGNSELARLAFEISKEFRIVSMESLKKNFRDITAASVEDRESTTSDGNQIDGGHGDELTNRGQHESA